MPSKIPLHSHILKGCASTPLAHYMKALGILRLVCEQADPKARGAWKEGHFELQTTLDAEALERFFLEDYAPTPVVTPWNGGSGFFPKDNHDGIRFVGGSSALRFASYRQTLLICRELLSTLGIETKPDPKNDKPRLLEACRARLPDVALDWLDAAYVLGETDPRYPPLLGTGGNDGRLEYANNFMQRLSEILPEEDKGSTHHWLEQALWSRTISGLKQVSIGQFQPESAGGANAAAGFVGPATVNPWDFVLMIEGALVLAASAVRRFDGGGAQRGRASFPFSVFTSAVGYGSAADGDEQESRGELWLPLWEQSIGFRQLRSLMGEGRAEVGGRSARSGLDFARAVSSLGVDRGIDSFERYGFHVRNGLSYFATSLGRYRVGQSQHVNLLSELDPWLARNRSKCVDSRAPSSISRALRRFESRAFALCGEDDTSLVAEAFLALGDLQETLSSSLSYCKDKFVSPVPPLSRAWFEAARPEAAEARLAESLASVDATYGTISLPIRSQVQSVERRGEYWYFAKDDRNVDWRPGPLQRSLGALLQRRHMLAAASGSTPVIRTTIASSLADVDAFILGLTDDKLLTRWFRACLLLKPPEASSPLARGPRSPFPSAAYALLKLCFPDRAIRGQDIVVTPRISNLALNGRASDALRAAGQRLRASGLPPATMEAHASSSQIQRCAAALLFPLTHQDTDRLAARFLRPETNLEGTQTP